ncbi:MAG: dehydrogenase E1 component subunit alpha/beta [Chitinophagales bacterium]|nr:dehydrogenase E1 component subunit alpha/beta [Chitinophagales bacterium]
MTSTLAIQFHRQDLSNEKLLELYKAILLPRRIEEKMLLLLRQGRVSKWFSGIGQEAISVGVTKALQENEYVLPLHRNLGVFTSRNMPLERLFMQWQGKEKGFSKGRERSFHFGTNEYHIVGMISHLGPQLCVANGIALSHKLKDEKKISVAFTGEGGTSEGDFHEALNVASVWKLPVIFIIENNGYGLSTPSSEQYNCKHLVDRAIGYGMKSAQIDGNNILEVYSTISGIAKDIRETPEPWLIECMTFRMRGHEEASGVKYVPKEYFEEWGKKDPVKNYEQYLFDEGILNEQIQGEIRNMIDAEIEAGLKIAFEEPPVKPDTAKEIEDVYKPYQQVVLQPDGSKKSEKRLVDAVSDGLRLAMRKHPNLILMGQDIAEYGGVFKVTENFVQEFGTERVRNTPLCESAILGAGLGLSVGKMKSVIEMQFADFVSSGFTQVVNNLAKIHYRWGQNADVVVRMPTGAGVGAGPFHSQSNEGWFFHTPGLKVVYPSSPYDAKGLMLAAIEDPNPVMFFEHKFLYRSISEEIPDDYYTIEIGKAKLVSEGEDVSIITYGLGVHWAKEALKEKPEISADLLDLRTLLPLDYEAIEKTAKKTGRVIVLHEDTLTGGIGAELAAWISEHCFQYLDSPVVRSASLDTPVPFASSLEENFLPKERFKKQLEELLEF